MGVMNSLRERAGGIVVVILALSFGVLWMLQDTGVFDTVGSGQAGGNILMVNGMGVSADEFNQAVQQQVSQYEAQTGRAVTPQVQEQAREQAYNSLVNDRLIQQEMDRMNITVTDDELVDMAYGPNPHPIIRSYFGDSTGQVDRQLLDSFFSNPEATQDKVQLENFLRAQRRQQKLTNLLGATVHVSEEDVLDAYRRRNRSVDVQYVALPYAQARDSVAVTDADLRDYYDENREDYAREKMYTISYATVPKVATAADSTRVQEELESLRSDFEAAENDSLFMARNASSQPYNSTYYTASDLEDEVATAVFADPTPGRVVGPLFAGARAHLIKIQDVRPTEGTYVRARHILFQGPDADALVAQAETVQDSLQNGADFAALARSLSQDRASAAQGGDLGWFGEGQMVEPFTEAAFDASVGEVVGPVETQFGQHLIEVTARADREVRLADFTLSMRPSPSTLDDAENRLRDVAYYADDSGDFAGEAEQEGLQARQMQVEAGQTNIPGLGSSPAIARFLDGAREGAISDVIELDDRFVVVQLTDVVDAGYRPFDEVQNELRPRVVLERRRASTTQRMEEAMQGGATLQQLASALGTTVRTQQDLSYSTRSVPGVGSDPRFVGTAMGLQSDQTSRVVGGANAAYVMRVTGVDEPAPLGESEREQLRTQLMQQRRSQVLQAWISSLRDEADIQDNRAQFLR